MPLARSIAMRVIEKSIGKGMSGRAIIRRFKAVGGKWRRDDATTYIRKLENRVKYEPQIRALGFNEKVPRGRMIETDLGNQGKYRVYGEASFWDEELEGYYNQTVSFYTDDYSETGEYGEAFGKHFGTLYQEQDIEFIDFEQTGMDHNEGQAY